MEVSGASETGAGAEPEPGPEGGVELELGAGVRATAEVAEVLGPTGVKIERGVKVGVGDNADTGEPGLKLETCEGVTVAEVADVDAAEGIRMGLELDCGTADEVETEAITEMSSTEEFLSSKGGSFSAVILRGVTFTKLAVPTAGISREVLKTLNLFKL